jgi:hypothetical protein
MFMVRRVSALSQVLKEKQAPIKSEQSDNTALSQNDITTLPQSGSVALPQSDNTALPQNSIATLPQSDKTALSQNGITTLPQSDIIALPQNDTTVMPQSSNTAKQQRARKTDERDKVTYYLDPGQLDKLEDLRIAYKKATGKRLSEQDFMRLIVDRLELHILL